jgi:hypothetical protein
MKEERNWDKLFFNQCLIKAPCIKYNITIEAVMIFYEFLVSFSKIIKKSF